ncbi:MAG: YIP1 family protein [Gemmatimonadota bacterium]
MDEVPAATPLDEPVNASDSEMPSLPVRLVWAFFSPGRLMDRLAEKPLWGAALLTSAVIVALSVALIPIDIFLETQRQAMIDAGQDPAAMGDGAAQLMRVVIPVTTVLSTIIFSFIFAGLYTVVFAFILGDEGSYKQYLAALSHAWFIAAFIGLLLTPLKIMNGDAQLTLNLGLFMPFLPDGYIQNVFRLLDIAQIWSTLVLAQGAHAIDSRRSFGSAAAILLTITVLFIAILARFV